MKYAAVWLLVIFGVVIVTPYFPISSICSAISYPNCDHKGFSVVPVFQVDQENLGNPELSLSHNVITKVHSQSFVTLGENVLTIDLSNNLIYHIEKNAFDRVNKSLEILHLNNNYLNVILPYFFLHLQKLKILNVSYNQITSLEGSLVGLSSLRQLILDNNRLQSLPDYLIREGEDCFNCLATNLSSEISLSLSNNSLRYIPTCSIEKLEKANPHSKIRISSLSANALYCDCMDARWSLVHLKDFGSGERMIGGVLTPPTVCSFTHVQGVQFVPISDLLLDTLGICPHDLDHTNVKCNGAQLEIMSYPSVLTPTLKFAVRLNASEIKHYNITIVALDGTQWITYTADAASQSYIIKDNIRPKTKYTICIEPCSEVEHEHESISEHQFYGKICKPYYAAASDSDEKVEERLFQEYVYGVLGFTIFVLLFGLLSIYLFKWRPARDEEDMVSEVSLSLYPQTSKLRRQLDDPQPSHRGRNATSFASKAHRTSKKVTYRSPSGVYENDSELKIQSLVRKSLAISPSTAIVISTNPARVRDSVLASARETARLSSLSPSAQSKKDNIQLIISSATSLSNSLTQSATSIPQIPVTSEPSVQSEDLSNSETIDGFITVSEQFPTLTESGKH